MKLLIVSGISGIGKSTLVKQFVEENEDKCELVKSVTTRCQRSADDFYTFVTEAEFMHMKNQGVFLETNMYRGSKGFYGTPGQEVERIAAAGKIPVLEIDVHGKRQIKCSEDQHGLESISIFITAPAEVVYKRLLDRGEPMGNILPRLKTALEEIEATDEYDYIIENCSLKRALQNMQDVVAGNAFSSAFDAVKYRSELIELIEHIENEGMGETID